MATANFYPARGNVAAWGDKYGNWADRFVSTVAYVDGSRPSLIMGLGYYARPMRTAWDYSDGKLSKRWVFDSNMPGNNRYAGQGNHQLTVGDVDSDGKMRSLMAQVPFQVRVADYGQWDLVMAMLFISQI